jgi:hypothetical protein
VWETRPVVVLVVSVTRTAAGTAPLEEETLPGPEQQRSEVQAVLVDGLLSGDCPATG